jgi:hypothetical protein
MVAVQARHEGDTFSEQLMKGKITGESTIVKAAMAQEKRYLNEKEANTLSRSTKPSPR